MDSDENHRRIHPSRDEEWEEVIHLEDRLILSDNSHGWGPEESELSSLARLQPQVSCISVPRSGVKDGTETVRSPPGAGDNISDDDCADNWLRRLPAAATTMTMRRTVFRLVVECERNHENSSDSTYDLQSILGTETLTDIGAELSHKATQLEYVSHPALSPGHISLDELPEEVLLRIFSFLSHEDLVERVSQVCTHWEMLAFDSHLWTRAMCDFDSRFNAEELVTVLRHMPLLRYLSFRGRELTRQELRRFLGFVPGLQQLNLGFCRQINNAILSALLGALPRLTGLNLEGVQDIKDTHLRMLADFRHLHSINLSHCTCLTDEGLLVLFRQAAPLQALNIDGISSVSDRTIAAFVGKHHRTLHSLWLDGECLSDVSMKLVSECSELQLLSISFCNNLTDQCLQFMTKLRGLEYLRLKKGEQFTSKALCSFFKEYLGASQLRALDMSECTTGINNEVAATIGSQCSNVQLLRLCWCWNMQEDGLVEIVTHCAKLRHLDLTGLKDIKGRILELVPDSALPVLSYLNLQQCNHIVDSIVSDMVRRKPMVVFNYYGERLPLYEESSSMG